MNYKIEGAIKNNRKNLVIFGILWLFIAIVLIVPITLGANAVSIENSFADGVDKFIQTIASPFEGLKEIISLNLIQSYFKNVGVFTIGYGILIIIKVAKSAPKHEYTDMEHGSSDWSKNGEQYKILNSKKGIVLAENNYLPVDKRGNVNVLVVGRFRFW